MAGRQKPPCGARPNVAFRLSGPQCGGTDGPPTEKTAVVSWRIVRNLSRSSAAVPGIPDGAAADRRPKDARTKRIREQRSENVFIYTSPFSGIRAFFNPFGAFSDNRSGLLSGRLRRIPASRVLLPDRPERTPHDAFRSSDRHPETAPPVPPERPGRTPHGSGGRQIVAITLFFGK